MNYFMNVCMSSFSKICLCSSSTAILVSVGSNS